MARWRPHGLVIIGLVLMLIGVLDPLEGSVVIVAGSGMAALGARSGNSRHRLLVYWSSALIAIGVGAIWGLSAIGGIRGRSGHSVWWGSLILPYPVGWILGLVAAIRMLREPSNDGVRPRRGARWSARSTCPPR
jgi:hypothetical protein